MRGLVLSAILSLAVGQAAAQSFNYDTSFTGNRPMLPVTIFCPTGTLGLSGPCTFGGGGGGGTTDTRVSAANFAVSSAGARYQVAVNAQGVVAFAIAGLTASGATLTPQFSNDGGSTWTNFAAITSIFNATVTADGPFRLDAAGHTHVALLVTGAGSGSVSISYSATATPGIIQLGAPLPPGSNLIGNVKLTTAPATYTQTSVSVSAASSTQLIAANATRRKLDLIPSTTTCTVNFGTSATSTSQPIPNGWSYVQDDPPPSQAVNAYCTSATTISVTEGN